MTWTLIYVLYNGQQGANSLVAKEIRLYWSQWENVPTSHLIWSIRIKTLPESSWWQSLFSSVVQRSMIWHMMATRACKMTMQSVLYLCRSSRPVLKTQDGSQRVELQGIKTGFHKTVCDIGYVFIFLKIYTVYAC